MKQRILLIFFDLVLVIISFFLLTYYLPGTWISLISKYFLAFLILLVVWYLSSSFNLKYRITKTDSILSVIKRILISNITTIAFVALLMFVLKLSLFSRKLLVAIVVFATIIELFYFYFINAILTSVLVDGDDESFVIRHDTRPDAKEPLPLLQESLVSAKKKKLDSIFLEILQESGTKAHDLIHNHVLSVSGDVRIVSTSTRFNIISLDLEQYNCIVNIQRVNSIKRINKFFEAVNSKLSPGGLFIGKAETYVMRKARILDKFLFPFNYLFYTIDFVIKRIWPKVPIINKLYFLFTHGNNRVLSRAEVLGRLYSCGFEVVEEIFINKELYFVVRKIKEPLFPENPTYGPLIKLKRIGKEGKYFNVYKMRTMHPYAEYLQGYVFDKNHLEVGGKIKDDFRVTTLGSIMRKLWIDELPMLINLFKGEMKIVGVRPLSAHYYNLYSEELQQLRIRSKPGLVPPFYADLPKTLDEIMDSEMKYLLEHQKHPLKTDIKYFFMAFKNIIFKHARSN